MPGSQREFNYSTLPHGTVLNNMLSAIAPTCLLP